MGRLFRQRRQWCSIFAMGHIYNNAVGHRNGAPLSPEAPYPIHQPPKTVRITVTDISCCAAACWSQVNCQYTILHNFANYAYIFTTGCTGAPYVTKQLSGGRGRPPPPIEPPLVRCESMSHHTFTLPLLQILYPSKVPIPQSTNRYVLNQQGSQLAAQHPPLIAVGKRSVSLLILVFLVPMNSA